MADAIWRQVGKIVLAAGLFAAATVSAQATTVLRGAPSVAAVPGETTVIQLVPVPLQCRDGFYAAGGVCRPYSWSSGTSLW